MDSPSRPFIWTTRSTQFRPRQRDSAAPISDPDAKTVRQIFWATLTVQVAVGLAAWYATFVLRLSFLQDVVWYENIGHSIAVDWLDGRSSSWISNRVATRNDLQHLPMLLIYMVAAFYTLTLGIRALPLLIVSYALVTARTPCLMFRICQWLGTTRRAALVTAWLVALSPAFTFFSGALHKEGLMLFVLAASILHTLKLQRQWTLRSLATVGICLTLMAFLRLYVAVIMSMVLALGISLQRPGGQNRPDLIATRQVLIAVGFCLAMMAAGTTGTVLDLWPRSLEFGFEGLDEWRRNSALAPSGYLVEANISSPLKALTYLPQGMLYFMSVPWPWDWRSIRQNIAIPDTTIWVLVVYPCFLLGAIKAIRRNFHASIPILAAIAAMACFYSVFLGNVGIAYRMRIQIWLLMAVFAESAGTRCAVVTGWSMLGNSSDGVGSVRVHRERFPHTVA